MANSPTVKSAISFNKHRLVCFASEISSETLTITVSTENKSDKAIVDLYAMNSKSIPYEDHSGNWEQFIPTWRFYDSDNNITNQVEIDLHPHETFYDILTGSTNIKFCDDSESTVGDPIILFATLNTSGYPLSTESATGKPGYANSLVMDSVIVETNRLYPEGLIYTKNLIDPLSSSTYWQGQIIPAAISVYGNPGQEFSPEPVCGIHTVYEYPYSENTVFPVSAQIFSASDKDCSSYVQMSGNETFLNYFLKYSDENNKYRIGGYTITNLMATESADYAFMSACGTINAVPTNYITYWTWFGFPNSYTKTGKSEPYSLAFNETFINPTTSGRIEDFINNQIVKPESEFNEIATDYIPVDFSDEVVGDIGSYNVDIKYNTWISNFESGKITKYDKDLKPIFSKHISDYNIPFIENDKVIADNIWISIKNTVYLSSCSHHLIITLNGLTGDMINYIYKSDKNNRIYTKTGDSKLYDTIGKPVKVMSDIYENVWVLYFNDSTRLSDNRTEAVLVKYNKDLSKELCRLNLKNHIFKPGYENINITDATYYGENIYILANGFKTATHEQPNLPQSFLFTIFDIKSADFEPTEANILEYSYFPANTFNATGIISDWHKNIYFYASEYATHDSTSLEITDKVFKISNLATSPQTYKTLSKRIVLNNPIELQCSKFGGMTFDYTGKFTIADNTLNTPTIKQYYTDETGSMTEKVIRTNTSDIIGFGDIAGTRLAMNWVDSLLSTNRVLQTTTDLFKVENYDKYRFRKHNDSWNAENHFKLATNVPHFLENNDFFDKFIKGVYGSNLNGDYSIARKLYEGIANQVRNIHDIDECNVDALYSHSTETDVPINDYTAQYPEELKRIMDVASINHEKIWGDRCDCDDLYFKDTSKDHSAKKFCDKCHHYHTSNLGDMVKTTDEISLEESGNHPTYLAESTFNHGKYVKITPSTKSIQAAKALINKIENMEYPEIEYSEIERVTEITEQLYKYLPEEEKAKLIQEKISELYIEKIMNLPESYNKRKLILKLSIQELENAKEQSSGEERESIEHAILVAVHTDMFTKQPWFNYCLYHYVSTRCNTSNISVINWDDRFTHIDESDTSVDNWYKTRGTVEKLFSYVLHKGLGFAIRENSLDHITVTRNPKKMDYSPGEIFNPANMIVEAVYTDGSTKIVKDLNYMNKGPLQMTETGKAIITITYTENCITRITQLEINIVS